MKRMKGKSFKKVGKKPIKKHEIVGGLLVPRNFIHAYPKKIASTKLTTSYSTTMVGATYYDNFYVKNTAYRPLSGVASIFPGRTAISSLYNGYLVRGVKVTATVNNTVGLPVVFQLTNNRSVGSDHSGTFADYRTSPDCKSVVLAKVGATGCQRTLSQYCDMNKMVGYNISTTNMTSYWAGFGADPGTMGGINMSWFSTDLSTNVTVDLNLIIELDVVLFNPNLILS